MSRHPDPVSVFRYARVASGLLSLIALIGSVAAIAMPRYPPYFSQRGARELLVELSCALLTYAIAVSLAARIRAGNTDTIYRTALRFGVLTGLLEVLNIAIENGIPFAVQGPALQIGFMALTFGLWGGVAGFRVGRLAGSFGAGLGSAVGSAMICMVLAVTGGFLLELFLFPPQAEYVSTWAEFRRSGWTDAHAFALANTLESGFTHLAAAPVIGAVFGSIGSGIGLAFAPSRGRVVF
ncbi:MAG: hypothetical protein JOZ29_18505 [Deltaproteobacteria bacterium]|nr:hypothetical protein [Deltaproteobacteria bacterium]